MLRALVFRYFRSLRQKDRELDVDFRHVSVRSIRIFVSVGVPGESITANSLNRLFVKHSLSLSDPRLFRVLYFVVEGNHDLYNLPTSVHLRVLFLFLRICLMGSSISQMSSDSLRCREFAASLLIRSKLTACQFQRG